MIRYYHDFLSMLSDYLSSSRKDDSDASQDPGQSGSYVIYGKSLAGFGGENVDALNGTAEERYLKATTAHSKKYYNLQEQIAFVEGNLLACVERWRSMQQNSDRKPKVIVIGHSVGGYISMELLRRHRERKDEAMDVIGEILLFPTVVDIAKSPSGVKFKLLSSLFLCDGQHTYITNELISA